MKHDAYFFDMDQTLTKSKTEITGEHFKLLTLLAYKAPVIIVSGAVIAQMMKQLLSQDIWYLAQNGNHALTPNGETLWVNELNETEVAAVTKHIDSVARHFKYKVDETTVQNRGCQVSFSLVGHDADINIKEQFDPQRKKRNDILYSLPFKQRGMIVKIGGTTCLDYTSVDGTKGVNVQRMIDEYGFENPIYLGDALFKGGNDETVIGVCKTKQVNSLEETYQFIREQL